MKIGFYHSADLDGLASGAIMKMAHPDIELIGYNYGDSFPWERINSDTTVYMADVSLPINDMVALAKKCEYFCHLDHHVSAIEDYNNLADKPDNYQVVHNSTLSACEICWNYFIDKLQHTVSSLPIVLLGNYDTYRSVNDISKYWETTVLPYQYYARTYLLTPDDVLNHIQNFEYVNSYLPKGKAIYDYIKSYNKKLCNNSFVINFLGYRAIVVNAPLSNSLVFDSVYDEDKHDLMMPFSFNGKTYKFSIFTTKDIDCHLLARKFGGGGHKKAAGFVVNDLNVILNDKI